ncbi:geranylgeranyl transferase type-2 subunit alpha 1 [Phoenix dactylifera]|uniref:Geranylgeranyl transferase type-2 subunit alpha n=1 Tax=Phoenix dactylifera TaxID=42345 RepID=A0A8B7BGE4_PHODC|nr:geranylgeranyl transferase type-2 subunit alpha 1 [Phoenix dactylifera]
MHGRPRIALKPEDAATSAAKAAKLRDLQAQLLLHHHHRIYTSEALAVSSKLLEMNPEIYTAWNYRKLALQHNLNEVTDPEIVKSTVEDELRVVEMALRRNPKSYGAWYHRKWVLSRGLAPVDFEREFRLLDQLLKADARNFHGWTYRRFVAKLKNVSEEEEIKFTMDMINTNFSNYSAWHNRSVLLSQLLKQKAQGFDSKDGILTEEYEFVHQALFTDPSDQSGWFYHLWLLDQTASPDELFLISSWPVPGSDLVLSTNEKMDGYKLFPTSNFSLCYFFHKQTFPIILYFNQAVKGVSSSTVTINSMFGANENLIWKPLSTTTSREAHCWVTYLNIPDVNSSSLQACSVEISLGHSEGIVSSNGSCYKYPLQFKYTIKLNNNNLEQFDGESIQELFVWNYEDVCCPAEIPYINSFDQLKISEDSVAKGLKDKKWCLETLSNEINLFKELSEENCKFVNLTLARLLVAHDAMMSHGALLVRKSTHSEEVLKLYEELIKLDPTHKRYYEDERSLVLMSQVTLDEEFLMKHTWHFNKLTSSSFHNHACLQLSGLSLSRISFAERLLWVQMLDLSHNNLRSIAGLEALQLLVCLNLSNNQVSSFTALEPLKLLDSLRVLDVSFNEIGAHPIDTTRFLCLSPLSHTLDVKLSVDQYQNGDIKFGDHWEAILLFKDLRLTQLDVRGNAVANERFGILLTEMLPTLNWLNGEHVRL